MNSTNIDYVPIGSWLIFIKKIKNGSWKKNEPIQKATALYKCKCGIEKEYIIISVKSGKRKSCGCRPRTDKPGFKHGFSNHQLYAIWHSMKARCYNKKNTSYMHYGGRGVTVCDEWRSSSKSFIDWAFKNGWQPGLEIDKDIKAMEGGIPPLIYSPDMCQFITPSENCSSRRSNRLIHYNGKTQTLNKWAIEMGLKRETIAKRIDELGYTTEMALTKKTQIGAQAKPIKQINKQTSEIIAKYDSIVLASMVTGIGYGSISANLRKRIKTAGGFKWEYA